MEWLQCAFTSSLVRVKAGQEDWKEQTLVALALSCFAVLLAAAVHVLATFGTTLPPFLGYRPQFTAHTVHSNEKQGIQPSRTSMTQRFLNLPGELLAAVLDNLSREDLYELNLASEECHKLAAPLIWKHVDLIDCRAHTCAVTGYRTVSYGPGSASHSGRGIPAGASVGGDEHDDTPLIRKLYILAT